MNRIHIARYSRRAAGILAGLASAVLASLAAAPAAFASTSPGPAGPANPEPLPGPAQLHAAVTGGMSGWQITPIAVAATALAAAVTVLLRRARATRRHVTVPAA